ncbi:MAG: hypothetical protein HY730_01575 [Candidatus Tectomicrobia bacterium]|uniref:Uncharacterized protein n=1 Tax=Tectimicrobiota bacterium TaxID=2528274 RepID=A0A933LPG6_UNCTE|nr:hypothetical protein [Candidatus Tectomicrobia bacterium]
MINQLLNQIYNFLLSRCTLRDLEAWLVANLQDILDSKDAQAVELADKIDADLVALGEKLIDEATLYERLENYVDFYSTISMNLNETKQTTSEQISTAVTTIRGQLVVPGLVENLRGDFVFV